MFNIKMCQFLTTHSLLYKVSSYILGKMSQRILMSLVSMLPLMEKNNYTLLDLYESMAAPTLLVLKEENILLVLCPLIGSHLTFL